LTALSQEQREDTDALREENTSLRAQNDKSQQAVELNKQQISATQLQLETVQQHNRSLEEKHYDAPQTLAHYRDAIAQQRERENEKHEQECALLRQSSHKTQQALTAKQTVLANAQNRIDTLKSELAVIRNKLEARITSEAKAKHNINCSETGLKSLKKCMLSCKLNIVTLKNAALSMTRTTASYRKKWIR